MASLRMGRAWGVGVALLLAGSAALAEPNEATPATRAAQQQVTATLPLGDRADVEDAQRGLIAPLPNGVIAGTSGAAPVWDLKPYEFLKAGQPADTVNPSLWRQAQLNLNNGLFKVAERVYQLRGFDIANITIVEGDSGLIVTDATLTTQSAKAALDLYYQHRPKKPVLALIYTHSHADHFGGAGGLISEADAASGKVKVIAPEGFMEHAVAENVIAGNAMSRRAQFQFGTSLPVGERGQVDAGLGKALANGKLSLIAPNDVIKQPYETRVIDGVEIEFHLVPGSEAPAEMISYYPQFKVLNMAEDTTHNMHNLYTIRGAAIRDGRLWSKYIGEALDRYGDRTEVVIAQHHWPVWGRERVAAYLKKQRDLYKFIHDQSVRLLNHGLTATEIAERLKLPPTLANEFSTRGYYGSLSHNAKAVYQFYLAGTTLIRPISIRCRVLRRRKRRSTIWAARPPCCSGPAMIIRPGNIAGWRRSPASWCLPIPATRKHGRSAPMRWNSSAIRRKRRPGATPICSPRRSCAKAFRKPQRPPTPPMPSCSRAFRSIWRLISWPCGSTPPRPRASISWSTGPSPSRSRLL